MSALLAAISNQRALDLTLQQISESPTQHGFTALFKNDSNKAPLQTLLNKIKDRPPIDGLLPDPDVPVKPSFACVTAKTQSWFPYFGYDPMEQCIQNRGMLLYVTGTSYIFYCPGFFNLPAAPIPPYTRCPPVENNEFAAPRGSRPVTSFQAYYILLGLIEIYLQRQKLTPYSTPPITWRLNEAVELDPQSSLRNPVNTMSFLAFVEQECTEFPDPTKPPFVPPDGLNTNSANASAAGDRTSNIGGNLPPLLNLPDHNGSMTAPLLDSV